MPETQRNVNPAPGTAFLLTGLQLYTDDPDPLIA